MSQESKPPFRRDARGVPILDAEQVERLSEHFLFSLVPRALRGAGPAPLAEIVTVLRDRGMLAVEFDLELGYSRDGQKYLGCFLPKQKKICIDRSLGHDDPRFPFTLAHELAHFYLHGPVDLAAVDASGASDILDTARDLVIHRVEASRPRSRIEWQANRFAAGILVPRATINGAVISEQTQMGISRRLGLVWLDQQTSSRRDYRAIVARLATLYGCSRAVMRYRLAELGISREYTADGRPRHVGELMRQALQDLFGKVAADT